LALAIHVQTEIIGKKSAYTLIRNYTAKESVSVCVLWIWRTGASTAVGIAQIAHAVGESILCHKGGNVVFPNDFGEDLFLLMLLLLLLLLLFANVIKSMWAGIFFSNRILQLLLNGQAM